MNRSTRITFNSPYESVRWTAEMNAKHFEDKAAEKLFREAADLAPNDELKQECLRLSHYHRRMQNGA